MKLLSLFDGEGGFPLAAVMNGIEPVAASEIEPYPIAITRSRFPNMKHLGDVSLINGAEIEPVDIVTFGSPCQSMSVAGKREGLKHESQGDEQTTRSGLFFESIRIITEMRKATNGKCPRFAVWENVPGAFSSGGGRDFLAVLQAFSSIAEPTISIPEPERDRKTDNLIWLGAGSIVGNGFSIAYRTFDAQHWGVPQRRKRIYLIADFRTERAAEILLEPYRNGRDIASGKETRQGTTEDVARCADRGFDVYNESGHGYWMPGFGGLRAEGENRPSRPSHCVISPEVECLNPWDSQTSRIYDSNGVHPSVNANSGGGQDRHAIIQPSTLVFDATQITSPTNGNNPQWNAPSHSLSAQALPPTVICAGFCGKASAGAGTVGFGEETGATIRAGQETHCVIAMATQQGGAEIKENLCPTVTAAAGMSGNNSPVIALQANGIDRADTAGCNGAGWREDQSYTLNTVDRHAVCYQENIGSLCARDYEGIGNQYVDENKLVVESPRLATRQRSDEFSMCDVASTESHRQYKDATDIVIHKDNSRRYIVRRLMPIETTRLQGFPDFWHHLAPFDGDVEFWESVRKTWAGINGTTYKPFKDVARLEKWYYGLRNDGAEYKVDGNSLAMPCAEYVIRRIAETVREEEKLSAEERI